MKTAFTRISGGMYSRALEERRFRRGDRYRDVFYIGGAAQLGWVDASSLTVSLGCTMHFGNWS